MSTSQGQSKSQSQSRSQSQRYDPQADGNSIDHHVHSGYATPLSPQPNSPSMTPASSSYSPLPDSLPSYSHSYPHRSNNASLVRQAFSSSRLNTLPHSMATIQPSTAFHPPYQEQHQHQQQQPQQYHYPLQQQQQQQQQQQHGLSVSVSSSTSPSAQSFNSRRQSLQASSAASAWLLPKQSIAPSRSSSASTVSSPPPPFPSSSPPSTLTSPSLSSSTSSSSSSSISLHVSGIPSKWSEVDLIQFFGRFGTIIDVRIFFEERDRTRKQDGNTSGGSSSSSGNKTNTAHVMFEDMMNGIQAVAACDGHLPVGSNERLAVKLLETMDDGFKHQSSSPHASDMQWQQAVADAIAAASAAGLSPLPDSFIQSLSGGVASHSHPSFPASASVSPSVAASSAVSVAPASQAAAVAAAASSHAQQSRRHGNRGRYPGVQLFVFHLPTDLTSDDLLPLFSFYGPVLTISIMYDEATGQSRGFAFVSMKDYIGAAAAVQGLNGFRIGKKVLKVSFKQKKVKEQGNFGRPRRTNAPATAPATTVTVAAAGNDANRGVTSLTGDSGLSSMQASQSSSSNWSSALASLSPQQLASIRLAQLSQLSGLPPASAVAVAASSLPHTHNHGQQQQHRYADQQQISMQRQQQHQHHEPLQVAASSTPAPTGTVPEDVSSRDILIQQLQRLQLQQQQQQQHRHPQHHPSPHQPQYSSQQYADHDHQSAWHEQDHRVLPSHGYPQHPHQQHHR